MENGCLLYKMTAVVPTTLPGVGSRGYQSQVLGVLSAFLPVSVLSGPAHPCVASGQAELLLCAGTEPPLGVGWVKKGAWMEPSPLIPVVLYLGRVCFPAVENQLLISPGGMGRSVCWWWRETWLGSCRCQWDRSCAILCQREGVCRPFSLTVAFTSIICIRRMASPACS